MKRFAFLLMLTSFPALAQYAGPAVDTCLAYATNEVRQGPGKQAQVLFVRDQDLVIERYTRKLGSQFVSSMLLGNGAVVHATGAPIEMSFICLLADEKRALFFAWLPRRDAPVLAQCRRGKDVKECLDYLHLIAERDLTEVYSKHFLEARQAGDAAADAFRRSTDAFKAYLDAECARRGAPDARKACEIELTRRRALDFR
jgi:hypothetical protein